MAASGTDERQLGGHTVAKRRPDLETLSSVNPDGSRRAIYPAEVRGRFQVRKRLLWVGLIAVYLVMPWVTIGGHPAILIDIARREFYLFGNTFNSQDFYLAFFWVSGIGFTLIVISAVFGRLWCGFGCPQTVFLEGVFRRIERWIEGTAAQRRRLAAAPWTAHKILRKVAKHALFVAIALALAHTFLGYFMPARDVLAAVTEPPIRHLTAFLFVLAFTAIMFVNFVWFREQLCIVICPYGRLQSALTDADTINVAYDGGRGEPRGKLRGSGNGDCIDCCRCVAVCPTGIDIRNGTPQLECVGCANCIDACDEVMSKIGRPAGLIRYDSQRGIEQQRRRFVRPRLFVYAVFLVIGLTVFLLSAAARTPFEANPIRLQGSPYVVDGGLIRNQLYVHLVNKQPDKLVFSIVPVPGQPFAFVLPVKSAALEPFADRRLPVFVTLAEKDYRPGLQIRLVVRAAQFERSISLVFLGPAGR